MSTRITALCTILIAVLLTLATGPVNSAPIRSSQECSPQPLLTITGMSGPKGLAMDTARNLLYVANYNANNILAIDGETHTIVRVIGGITSPNQIAYDSVADRLFITNRNSNRVTVLDAASYLTLGLIPVGAQPYGVAVNSATRQVLAANFSGNSITIFHADTLQWLGQVWLQNRPTFIVADAVGGINYAVSSESGFLYTIDAAQNGQFWASVGDTGIVGLAFDPVLRRLFVSSVGNKVYAYDPDTANRLAVIDLPGTPKAMAVNPLDQQVFVATWSNSNGVHQIDGQTLTYRGAAATGRGDGDGIAVNPSSGLLYVSNFLDNTISVLRDSCSPGPTSERWGTVEVSARSITGPANNRRAQGDIRLGQGFRLEGDAAWASFDGQTIRGEGKLMLVAGAERMEWLNGRFSADPSSGRLTPAAGATSPIGKVGAFIVSQAGMAGADLNQGRAEGTARLSLSRGAINAQGRLSFAVQAAGQRLQYEGTMQFEDGVRFGDGTTLKVAQVNAPLQDNGTQLAIAAPMQVRLPQANHFDLPMIGAFDASGQLQMNARQFAAGTVLRLASVQASLGGISFWLEGDRLRLSDMSIPLPPQLNGASIRLTGISIDQGGLHFDNVMLAAGKPLRLGPDGFNIELREARVESALPERAYRLVLAGVVQLNAPSVTGNAAIEIWLDSLGRVGGAATSLQATVVGLTLQATNIRIEEASLRMASATLRIPPEFGNGGVTVQNVVLSRAGIQIGSGSFRVPDIDYAGFRLTGLNGGFEPLNPANPDLGYRIHAGGRFEMPNLGGAAGCSGIAVDVAILTGPGQELWVQMHTPTAADGVSLEEAHISLSCTIPIPNTGFAISGIDGGISLAAGHTQISVGMTVISQAELQGVTVLSARADVTVQVKPEFFFDFNGIVQLFGSEVGGGNVHITPRLFSSTLWINYKVFKGQVRIHAWNDATGFNFTGQGTLTVSAPRGVIVNERWLTLPPSTMELGGVDVGLGKFTNNRWGFRGTVCLWKFCIGVYVDQGGNVAWGDVKAYTLKSPPEVAQALMTRQGGAAVSTTEGSAGPIALPTGDVAYEVAVTEPTDLLFAISKQNELTPTLTLQPPSGPPITDSQPPTITHTTLHTPGDPYPFVELFGVQDAAAGTWQAIVGAVADPPDGSWGIAILGGQPQPRLDDLHAAADPAGAALNWRLTSSQPVTISIFAHTGPLTITHVLTDTTPPTLVEQTDFGGTLLHQQVFAAGDGNLHTTVLTLESLAGGEYHFWLEADNGLGPPVRQYASEPVHISHPWPQNWQAGLQATPDYRSLALTWARLAHPDVDGYALLVDHATFTQTLRIEIGDITTYQLDNLSWGHPYHLRVQAVDTDQNQTLLSEEIMAQPRAGDFALSVVDAPALLLAGSHGAARLWVSTPLTAFPDTVGLYATLPGGFALTFSTDVITPTQAGAWVEVDILSAATLPSGEYDLHIWAVGGGDEERAVIRLRISQLAHRAHLPLLMTQRSPLCSEQVVNGGFEEDTGWWFPITASRGGYSNQTWRSGARSARLGLLPGAEVMPLANAGGPESNLLGETAPAGATYSTVHQRINIPADAISASLSFWYLPRTEAGAGDWQRAALLRPDDFAMVRQLLRTISHDPAWRYASFDLSALRGQDLILYFEVFNNETTATGRTAMFVDDVSLYVCTR